MTVPFAAPSAAVRVAMQLWRIGVVAPQVIALRMLQIAAAGSTPTVRDRREMQRMVDEKAQAVGESWMAMATAATGAAMTTAASLPLMWLDPAAARRVAAVSARVLERGVEPFDRRVHANGRRLTSSSRRRRR